MSKNGVRGYITLVILAVVLSVFAFTVPSLKTAVFWIAYVFGLIAIGYQIYVFKISFSGKGDVKSKFYGFPIAKIGVVYLIGQLIISIIEMTVAAFLPLWIALMVNVIFLAAAVVGCIAADAMRDEIERQDIQLKKDVTNMRALQSMSASLAGQCTEPEVKRFVQSLADEFKYSDPVSSEQTKEIEAELQNQMSEMQRAIIDGDNQAARDFGNKILASLAERNRLCALNK